ncbi:MAG: hypothetical protein ACREMI_00140, partial [Gemmatimonadales bacterium]
MRWLVCVLVLFPAVVAGQVDPSGPWRTLHTQHFRVHFRPAYRDKARDVAAEAERAYALLARELHPPRGTIDLTVSDDVDTPNGFTTTYPSNRFTILLVPPVTDPGLQDFDSWERLVVVHELAHVFHLDRSRGLWGALQSIFGRAPGLFPNQYQPSWVIEGIATYYESRFTAGGRADGSFHRQVVAADVAAGEARSPWDALLFTRWPGGLAPYAYGSRFWEYLSQTGRDSVVPRFVEGTAGQFIPFRVGRPLRRVGASLEVSWRRALDSAGSMQPATRSRLIAGRLRGQPVARVSPDGRSLAYVHNDGRGAQRLRVIDSQSGAELRSHRVTGQVSFDWRADTLIIAQLDFTSRWTIRSDLWRWAPDGAWTRMTRNARLIEPRASGWVVSALELGRGHSIARLPPMQRLDSSATWGPAVPSRDGQWVVAPRHQDGRWSLVRFRTLPPQSLTVLAEAPPGSAIADPAWARPGVGGAEGGVLFVADAGGFPQIHLWTETGVTQVTAEPRGARAPAPLPDGRMVFATLGDGGWELRVVEPRLIARHAMPASSPATFDSAPPVPARETGYASWGSLRPHFWIPLALNAGDAGLFFGGATAGTDAVGRYSYLVQGLVSAAPARAQGSLFLISQALGDPTIDFSISNDWSLVGSDSTGHVVSSERRDAAIGATVMDRRWWSFVSLRVAAEYEGRRYVSIPDTALSDICIGCNSRDRVGGSASLSVGSAVSGPLSVSLQDGARATLLFRHRDEQGTSRWLNEVRMRGSVYLRLGPRLGPAYPVLALRGAVGAMNGPIIDRFSVGGVSSGAVELGFGQTLGVFRTFPVRGYASGSVRGRRAATLTAEYRVPLAVIGRSLGHLPLGADKLAVTVFGDLGDSWDPGEPARLHRLRSVGAELVGDVT